MSNTAGSPATSTKRGTGALLTGAVLVALGIVITLLGIAVPAGTAKEISATQIAAPKPAPVEWTTDLAAATTFGVYAATDGTDVTVTAADGIP